MNLFRRLVFRLSCMAQHTLFNESDALMICQSNSEFRDKSRDKMSDISGGKPKKIHRKIEQVFRDWRASHASIADQMLLVFEDLRDLAIMEVQ